ncbi:MAG: class I SAM-dependent rRNA methyltransferase [Planctomycetes bacterium]|nr:class I SAM-dependent rRNA methyltransferase [Planctomycetota bacterium]
MPRDCSVRRDFRETVRRAARLREALFGPFGREPRTDAYRLVNGDGDGVPGFAVEACAGFAVVQVLSADALPEAPRLEDALEEVLRPRGIVRKLRYERPERGRVPGESARGERPPQALVVREDGVPFEVELLGGLHTGLFTDMRDERARLRALARGRRVLNTFAYTGAFSVAAAAGGAADVTSVDVVAKVLERAKRNFRLSGIDPGAHRFARMEVLDHLRLAARRGWRFGAIVLDPPTFASFKEGRWSARAGYAELASLALSVLEPEGLLWACRNTEGLPPDHHERQVARAVEASGREAQIVATGGLPPDYPTPLSEPGARYLKVLVLRVF